MFTTNTAEYNIGDQILASLTKVFFYKVYIYDIYLNSLTYNPMIIYIIVTNKIGF